jgi:hypothetical protein
MFKGIFFPLSLSIYIRKIFYSNTDFKLFHDHLLSVQEPRFLVNNEKCEIIILIIRKIVLLTRVKQKGRTWLFLPRFLHCATIGTNS